MVRTKIVVIIIIQKKERKWEHLELNVILRWGWHGQEEGVGAAAVRYFAAPSDNILCMYIWTYSI